MFLKSSAFSRRALSLLAWCCCLSHHFSARASCFSLPGHEPIWLAAGGTNFRAASALCPVPAGAERVLLDVSGPGVIRHVLVDFIGAKAPGLVFRAWWDDSPHPAVCLPLGDAFKLNTDINVSYWPMPFARRARVSVSNEYETLAAVSYTFDGEYLPALPPHALYFHACWRHSPPTNDAPHVLLNTRGQGHLVAVMLKLHRLSYGTGMDGRDLVYIDDDTSPALIGSTLFDYFHDRGVGQSFSYPFSGRVPLIGAKQFATNSIDSYYRIHIDDPIRFSRSLKLCFEQRSYLGTILAHDNNIPLDYGLPLSLVTAWTTNAAHNRVVPASNDIVSVAYWYQTLPTTPQPWRPGVAFLSFEAHSRSAPSRETVREILPLRRLHSFLPYSDLALNRCLPVPLGAAASFCTNSLADSPCAVSTAHVHWAGVPFSLTLAPHASQAACVLLPPHATNVCIHVPVHVLARRLYVLCAAAGSQLAPYGTTHAHLEVSYENGARAFQPISDGEHVSDWRFGRHTSLWAGKFGWIGLRPDGSERAVYVFRTPNPLPHVAITSMTFRATGSPAALYILAVTAEQPADFHE